jgi:hypothetical protein
MKIVKQLKAAGQDFEFYPTTDKMISRLKSHLMNSNHGSKRHGHFSILDIGAGNGKVLEAIPADKKLAIEKSAILATQLPNRVLFVGSKFEEQTLFEIQADVTFSNPPYSIFQDWVVKILSESNSPDIYLVIPDRWKQSPEIAGALKARDAKTEILGSFDFEDGERVARAKVELVHIQTMVENCDRFESFVQDQFPKPSKPTQEEIDFQKEKAELTAGADYLERLVSCYNAERDKMQSTYLAVLKLDYNLLKSLEIDAAKLATVIRGKLQGLRDSYWREIFDRIDTINDKFTAKNKQDFMRTILSNTHVEFTVENAAMVIHWMIGEANRCIDSQLVDVWESMVERCNVNLYKSNKRTFSNDEWRWRACRDEEGLSHYKLDLRIVVHYCGGIHHCEWSYNRRNGLNERAHDFLSDLRVVAANLGFQDPTKLTDLEEWESGKKRELYATKNGEREVFAELKAFKNQNIHIKFSRRFLCSLNCEYGKIKGWLLNAEQAAEELKEPLALQVFNETHHLGVQNLPLLGGNEPKEETPAPAVKRKRAAKKTTGKKLPADLQTLAQMAKAMR